PEHWRRDRDYAARRAGAGTRPASRVTRDRDQPVRTRSAFSHHRRRRVFAWTAGRRVRIATMVGGASGCKVMGEAMRPNLRLLEEQEAKFEARRATLNRR